MAFQFADDLLDYTEGEDVTGKPGGSDLREHKVTLPLIAALPQMSAAQRAPVDALFANSGPDDTEIAEVIAIVTERGGAGGARGEGAGGGRGAGVRGGEGRGVRRRGRGGARGPPRVGGAPGARRRHRLRARPPLVTTPPQGP